MSNIISIPNKVSSINLGSKIILLNELIGSIPEDSYKKLGLVSAFRNTILTRIFCLKCNQNNNREKSHAYKSTKSICHHLVAMHKIDSEEYPTKNQCLKLIELHSILIQLGVVGFD